MKVKLSAQLLKVESRADRTYKLIFNTQELHGKDASALFSMLMDQGWLIFAAEDVSTADIPDEKPDSMVGQKTQAQRIRASLYRKWEQLGKKGDFEAYYRIATERFIDQIKASLE